MTPAAILGCVAWFWFISRLAALAWNLGRRAS